MKRRILLILLSFTIFSSLASTAAPPANIALNPPSEPSNAPQFNVSTLRTAALLNNTITFRIPDTKISLQLSDFTALLSQSELDICVIEGISSIFTKVLNKGGDSTLPLRSVNYEYGNVIINIYDFAAPTFRMTYASVVSTMRGIALFTSLFGYRAANFEVFEGRDHVGTGEFGPIIPR